MTVSNNEVAVIHNKAPSAESPPLTPGQLQLNIPIQTKVQVKVNQITVNLRNIPLLMGLSDEDMNKVKADMRVRHFNKRDVVLQKGGIGDSLRTFYETGVAENRCNGPCGEDDLL